MENPTLSRSNTHGRKRPVPMKFPWFHGSSIPMNGSGGRIYSVFAGIDGNLPQPATVYGHRFIVSDSYHFPTGFLPNTARFLAVFTGNAWEYCYQETLTWVGIRYRIVARTPTGIHRLDGNSNKIRWDSYRIWVGLIVGLNLLGLYWSKKYCFLWNYVWEIKVFLLNPRLQYEVFRSGSCEKRWVLDVIPLVSILFPELIRRTEIFGFPRFCVRWFSGRIRWPEWSTWLSINYSLVQ